MSDDTVVPLRTGSITADWERTLTEEFARKLRAYVEKHGRAPESLVIAMFGEGPNGFNWACGMFHSRKRSKIEAHSIAAGLLLRDT